MAATAMINNHQNSLLNSSNNNTYTIRAKIISYTEDDINFNIIFNELKTEYGYLNWKDYPLILKCFNKKQYWINKDQLFNTHCTYWKIKYNTNNGIIISMIGIRLISCNIM